MFESVEFVAEIWYSHWILTNFSLRLWHIFFSFFLIFTMCLALDDSCVFCSLHDQRVAYEVCQMNTFEPNWLFLRPPGRWWLNRQYLTRRMVRWSWEFATGSCPALDGCTYIWPFYFPSLFSSSNILLILKEWKSLFSDIERKCICFSSLYFTPRLSIASTLWSIALPLSNVPKSYFSHLCGGVLSTRESKRHQDMISISMRSLPQAQYWWKNKMILKTNNTTQLYSFPAGVIKERCCLSLWAFLHPHFLYLASVLCSLKEIL